MDDKSQTTGQEYIDKIKTLIERNAELDQNVKDAVEEYLNIHGELDLQERQAIREDPTQINPHAMSSTIYRSMQLSDEARASVEQIGTEIQNILNNSIDTDTISQLFDTTALDSFKQKFGEIITVEDQDQIDAAIGSLQELQETMIEIAQSQPTMEFNEI